MQMKHILIASMFAVMLSGCVPLSKRKPAFGKNDQPERAERAAMLAAMVDWQCNGKQAPPGHHLKQNVRQRCGLILNEIATADYWARFVESLCAGQADDQCRRKFNEMFAARMSERYTMANSAALETHCRAYPIECTDMRTVEVWTLSPTTARSKPAIRSACRTTKPADAQRRKLTQHSRAVIWRRLSKRSRTR